MCLKEQPTKHMSNLPNKSTAFRPALGVTDVLARVQALTQQKPTGAVLGPAVWMFNNIREMLPKLHLVMFAIF